MKRVEDLNKAYKQQVSDKIKNAEEEFKILESHETFTRENMQTMLFQKEQNRFKKEDQMNYEMFFKIDDERSKVCLSKKRTNFKDDFIKINCKTLFIRIRKNSKICGRLWKVKWRKGGRKLYRR